MSLLASEQDPSDRTVEPDAHQTVLVLLRSVRNAGSQTWESELAGCKVDHCSACCRRHRKVGKWHIGPPLFAAPIGRVCLTFFCLSRASARLYSALPFCLPPGAVPCRCRTLDGAGPDSPSRAAWRSSKSVPWLQTLCFEVHFRPAYALSLLPGFQASTVVTQLEPRVLNSSDSSGGFPRWSRRRVGSH